MVHDRRFLLLLAISSFLLIVDLLFGQSVTRGPYLQVGTPTSVIVRWRTDESVDSRVVYGPSPGSLNGVVESSQQTTEHEMSVTGLAPDTKYYYAVGTSATILAGGDDQHFFVTAPPPGVAKRTRIWILGDSGTADKSARAVRDAYYQFAGSRHTDLWLMLGDNAYKNGTDQQYQKAVFDMFGEMLVKSVLWLTLGNHDDNSSSSPGPYPYYDIFTLPKNGEAGGMASGTEAYYSFDYGNIHFINLNSATSSLRESNSPMWTWLEEDLAANDKEWTIAFWHHPPYSKGSHDSDKEDELIEMRERALPRLEDAGVDLVLGGHSHSYERSFLVDGHYGKSRSLSNDNIISGGDGRESGNGAYEKPTLGPAGHEGAVYLVNGCSGKTSSARLNHPIMVTSLKQLGSLVLDIDGNRLDATFLDDSGEIRDTFTIIKGSGAQAGPPAQLIKVSGDNQSAPVGAALPDPFVVEVRDANNRPVPRVTVSFDLTLGDGRLSNSQDVTAADGRASTRLTFGSETGDHVVTVTVSGLDPVLFTARALQDDAGPPAAPRNVRVTTEDE
ncbi:MAG: metallophosphoesterase [bacterium]